MSVAERRRSPPPRVEPTAAGTVLIVAGRELAGARLEATLRGRTGLRVAVSGPAELARRLDDVGAASVVLAVEPDDTGRALEALRGLSRVEGVVLLAADPSQAWTAHARRAGVRAVLRVDPTAEELVAAIAAVRAGLVVLHPDTLERPSKPRAADTRGGPASLTPREREILEMIAEGMSNRIIAGRLGISSQTVKFHVASILAKLGAASRTEAVTFGVRQGLIAL